MTRVVQVVNKTDIPIQWRPISIQWHYKQIAEGRGPIRFKQGSQVINNDKSTKWNDKLGSNGTANKSPKEGDQ